MASTKTRIISVVIAIVLFVTSVAAAGLVLYQVWQDSKQTKTSTAKNDPNKANEPTKQKEGTLEGTKLKDFTPVDSVSDLQSTDLKAGTGEEVKPGATVTAHYTGALAKDGTIFQSSHDRGEPIEFSLSGVIAGWGEGVPGMKVGGIRRLVIPAAKAYGDKSPAPSIPANSDLVFDIEITAVKNP